MRFTITPDDRLLLQEVLGALESLHRTGDTQVFDLYAAPVLIPAMHDLLARIDCHEHEFKRELPEPEAP